MLDKLDLIPACRQVAVGTVVCRRHVVGWLDRRVDHSDIVMAHLAFGRCALEHLVDMTFLTIDEAMLTLKWKSSGEVVKPACCGHRYPTQSADNAGQKDRHAAGGPGWPDSPVTQILLRCIHGDHRS